MRHAGLAEAPQAGLLNPVHTRSLLRSFTLALTLGLFLGVAGCASTQTKTAQEAPKAGDDEYVTVTETGSRVSRRVKKSELSQLQSPDLQKVGGQGWGTAGGDGGASPGAGGKGR